MKNLYLLTFSLLLSIFLAGQTEQAVIIEHFTNSRCAICASKNPAFYNTLNNYPQVLHIAFHPSSPYSTCIFSAHNPAENDARTNFYGIYGGTPRAVIQGEVVPPGGALISSSSIEQKLGNTSAYTVALEHYLINEDNYLVNAKIKKVAEDSQSLIFRGFLAEETVNYNAPNGEDVHHDVFRQNIFEESVSLAQVGDSVVLTTSYASNPEWVQPEIYVVGVLQNQNNKSIEQAAKSAKAQVMTVNNVLLVSSDLYFPNPAIDRINFSAFAKEEFERIRIFNLLGKEVRSDNLEQAVEISDLKKGYYLLVFENATGKSYTSKLVIN